MKITLKKIILILFCFCSIYDAVAQSEAGDILIKTEWHQGSTFSKDSPLCEYLFHDKRTPISCGAVAIGQLLNYYKVNDQSGQFNGSFTLECFSIASKLPFVENPIISIPVQHNYDNIYFDWDAISNGNEDHIANLLYNIATSLETDFTVDGSGIPFYAADKSISIALWELLKSTFNFKLSGDAYLYSTYSNDVQNGIAKAKLIEEIEQHCRPVLVAGLSKKGAHAWIIDGYDAIEDKFHMNMGWRDPNANTFYSLGNVSISDFHFTDIYFITGVQPQNLNPCQLQDNTMKRKNNQFIERRKESKNSNVCPVLVYPENNSIDQLNRVELLWTDIAGVAQYLVSLKAINSGIVYFDNISTYAGISAFTAKDILPSNEQIEVVIKALDDLGNIICTEKQYFRTSTTPCSLFSKHVDTKCNVNGSYNIELDFSGIPNRTYDIYAGWDGSTFPISASDRHNSVSEGYYVLGPIPEGQNVALIIEDESMPETCRIVEMVYAPTCESCNHATISELVSCDGNNYDLTVQVDGSLLDRFNVYTSYNNTNEYISKPRGTFVFEDIPDGTHTFVYVETVGSENCTTSGLIRSPNCSSTSCSPIPINTTSPASNFSVNVGKNITLAWTISSAYNNCIDEYEVQLSTRSNMGNPDVFPTSSMSKNFKAAVSGDLYWRVRAINDDGNYGDWSPIKRIDRKAEQGGGGINICNQPSGLFVGGITNNGAHAGWLDVEPDDAYEVQYGIGNYNTVRYVHATASSHNERELSPLSSDRTYQWRIRTNCSDGTNSDWKYGPNFTTLRSNQSNAQGDMYVSSSPDASPYRDLCKGQTINIDFTATYYGRSSQNVGVEYAVYFSDDEVFDGDDMFLSEGHASFGVASSLYDSYDKEDLAFDITLPYDVEQNGMQEFHKYLLFVADYNNRFIETNESNNTKSRRITFKCTTCCNENAHNYDPGNTSTSSSCWEPWYGCETCEDGIKNGDETEIDCGGVLCKPCEEICAKSIELITSNITSNSAKLSWINLDADVNSYTVYYKKANESSYYDNYTSSKSNTISDLIPNTQYCWYVRSNCDDGLTESVEICFTTMQGVFGCLDPNAHNYNSNATDSNNNCETCEDGNLNGDEIEIDCGGTLCIPCDCQESIYAIDYNLYDDFKIHAKQDVLANRKVYFSDIDIRAGNSIQLQSGFTIENGATFLGQIEDCPEHNLEDGLLAKYNFNGNANDESGNGNHGDVQGATLCPDRLGNTNAAYNFDGNDKIVVSYNNSLVNYNNNNGSLSLWFRPNLNFANGSNYWIFNGTSSTSSYLDFQIYKDHKNDKISWTCGGHYTGANISDFNEWELRWYHLTITWELLHGNKRKLSMFVDGNLTQSHIVDMGDVTNKSQKVIFGNHSQFKDMNGRMDDIRIYNRTLINEEVIALFSEI